MAYALIALGFVLALNAAGAVNFAHGDLVVLGGALAAFAGLWSGLPAVLLLPLVALAILPLLAPLARRPRMRTADAVPADLEGRARLADEALVGFDLHIRMFAEIAALAA